MCWLAVDMTATREAVLQPSWISSSQHWQSRPNEVGCQTVPLCFAHGEAQSWETSGLMSGERSASTKASVLLNVNMGLKVVTSVKTETEKEVDWKHNKWKWAQVMCINIISQCSTSYRINTVDTDKSFNVFTHNVVLLGRVSSKQQ